MPDHRSDFQPLDPGRINASDPVEVHYWSAELKCTEAQLRRAVAQAGEHVAAVRRQLEGERG